MTSLVVRHDPAAIAGRVRELAAEIHAAVGARDLVCVGVLPGSVLLLADLVRALPRHVVVDFVALTRTGGTLSLAKDVEVEVADRHVLLVDDIVDSGRSMAFLVAALRAREPASLQVCAFLDRVDRRPADLPVAFAGHRIGDEVVAGYGIPHEGRYAASGAVLEVVADPSAD
jgi:hypoxanthine phosphoribosyltransferase